MDADPRLHHTRVIAVVDDDPVCSMMTARVLTRSGYQAEVYGSGEALLSAVAGSRAEVICLDYALPGIDGIATMQRVRVLRPGLPVILLTGAADALRPDALLAGAFACVPKTGAWDELREAIGAALQPDR